MTMTRPVNRRFQKRHHRLREGYTPTIARPSVCEVRTSPEPSPRVHTVPRRGQCRERSDRERQSVVIRAALDAPAVESLTAAYRGLQSPTLPHARAASLADPIPTVNGVPRSDPASAQLGRALHPLATLLAVLCEPHSVPRLVIRHVARGVLCAVQCTVQCAGRQYTLSSEVFGH